MKRYNNPSRSEWGQVCLRPTATLEAMMPTVKTIFDTVKKTGDQALKEYTLKFDQVDCTSFQIPAETISEAKVKIPEPLRNAIGQAHSNITAFHSAQRTNPIRLETQPGVKCWQEKLPIERVGLYIPGG